MKLFLFLLQWKVVLPLAAIGLRLLWKEVKFAKITLNKTLIFMGLFLVISGPLHADVTWSFANNAEDWKVWGTPPDATPDEKQKIPYIVTWDAEVGHERKGSLKVDDTLERINCYTISPSVDVNPSKKYVFTGWVKANTDLRPHIFLTCYDSDGQISGAIMEPGSKKARLRVEYVGEADGWTSFRFEVPAEVMRSDTVRMQICIRPSGNANEVGFIGTIWLSDLVWKEL
ncbi:MAG: hypothetical protein V4507_13505 [Verrucomicrobiota bacterium]